MAQIPATTVRIDPTLKNAANEVFDRLGISLSAGIVAFLKAVVREQGIPFRMTVSEQAGTTPVTALTDVSDSVSISTYTTHGNTDLNRAGNAKRDEFYTQLSDISAELPNYKEQFAGKSILCNCDDPYTSNFFKFFVYHFNDYQLRSLIATSFSWQGHGLKAVITSTGDTKALPKSGKINNIFHAPGNSIVPLEGDGDFRSSECLELLDRADIVVTNPPFSLFRDYLGTLISHNKKFAILGNINAATYKEVFPLIKNNKVWFGASIHSGDRKFYVPDNYPLEATGCGIDEEGKRFIRVKGVRWFTNLDLRQRHTHIPLTKTFNAAEYKMFDNYNAINVTRTLNIPFDYPGLMGVPITFLDKYDPDQFEIIMLANGNVRANTEDTILQKVGYRQHPNDKGGVGVINGKRSYVRVLIRNRHPGRQG